MAQDWTAREVEALVADYFAMLAAELRGDSYSKTAHRRALKPLLAGRSDGSIERKHQNVSAVMIDLGYPYIWGYKPLANYQTLLFEVIAERVGADHRLANAVRDSIGAPAALPAVNDLLARLEMPPDASQLIPYPAVRERSIQRRSGINWLEVESRNHSLGRAGETFVLRFERARLLQAGKSGLADRVEHVAETDDGAGFAIRSFETNGRDRLIEVKTTAYGKQVPFLLSRNELEVSRRHADAYNLYRLFRFRDDPRLYQLTGALDQVCWLDPVQFSAMVR